MIISAAAVPIAFASSSSIAFDSQKGFQRAGGLPLFLHVLQRPKVSEWIGINSIISTSTTPSCSASPPCPSQLLNRTLIFTFIIIVVVVKDDFVLDAVTVAVLHSRWYPSCEELLVVASCCCSWGFRILGKRWLFPNNRLRLLPKNAPARRLVFCQRPIFIKLPRDVAESASQVQQTGRNYSLFLVNFSEPG